MNIFLIKYYKYDANNKLQRSWKSGVNFLDKDSAMSHAKEGVDGWNSIEKDGGYYTFEPLEYAPVAKVNEDTLRRLEAD
ncbi:MAG: hypothetical protein KIT59_01035 [Nitrosomonas sp.]|nr:hypothetical protein [Nitrosomonas sp.]